MKAPYEPEKMYHVYNHANGSENLFRNEGNYHYFLKKYAEYLHPLVETFAYCLMPNHFHLLIRVRKETELFAFYKEKQRKKLNPNLQGFQNLEGLNEEIDANKLISQQFSNFLNAYTKALNKQQERKGNLFQSNTKRKIVESENYYSQLVHYIHYNPIHHGFVSAIEDWAFSSYHAFLAEKKSKLNRREVLEWFGSRKNFEDFHQRPVSPELTLEIAS